MTTTKKPLKPSEKKQIVANSIAVLKGLVTPDTIVYLDERGTSPAGTSTNFKAIVVQNGELVNISDTVAEACCFRASKKREVIVKGMGDHLLDTLKAAISNVVFGNPTSLQAKRV